MQERFFHALFVSIEWRIVAFVVTNIFFWFTTHSLGKATGLALFLQLILFVVYTAWYFVRVEKGVSFLTLKKTGMPESRV